MPANLGTHAGIRGQFFHPRSLLTIFITTDFLDVYKFPGPPRTLSQDESRLIPNLDSSVRSTEDHSSCDHRAWLLTDSARASRDPLLNGGHRSGAESLAQTHEAYFVWLEE